MNELAIQMIPEETTTFLTHIYWWGIEVIKFIQKIETPALTAVLKFVTALGTQAFYVPVILFIFWWIDEKQGLRFGILILVSAWINSVVKDLLKQPRPYNMEPSLGKAFEPTYGAPSGHSQMSLNFWLPFAAWLSCNFSASKLKKKTSNHIRLLIFAVAVFMVLLIGFTRLYLGVHFPTDLFAGWIIAGIILLIYFIPGPHLEKFFASAGVRSLNISIAVIALAMNGLYPKDRSLPAVFLGFCAGYVLMKEHFPFFAQKEINGKKPGIHVMILRCLIGFSGIVIIYVGLKLLFPGEGSLFEDIPVWGKGSPFYELGRFIRYGLIGLWASAGAPKIFQRAGLASNTVS